MTRHESRKRRAEAEIKDEKLAQDPETDKEPVEGCHLVREVTEANERDSGLLKQLQVTSLLAASPATQVFLPPSAPLGSQLGPVVGHRSRLPCPVHS